ncbi:hypothetical protein GCM10008023_38230 [Sphingomonas glacialis]|uniref:Uncharacterized protein n=1 Tax=Sphingomonas glacialis TaxID=658225 RepID=A0ABQ3LSR7_9SPHN|nr:hypothetical protein GCM10008023_38230 [Sphingomonas glacialis]
MLADRRLGGIETIGCDREAGGIGDSDEGTEQSWVEHIGILISNAGHLNISFINVSTRAHLRVSLSQGPLICVTSSHPAYIETLC